MKSAPRLGSAVVRPPILTEQDRAIPSITPPSGSVLAPTNQAVDTFTYFTKASSAAAQLYTGDRPWAQVTVTLETAGPVAVAFKQNFVPVLSGKGTLIKTGQPKTFTVPKGKVLWIASTSVNRVSVTVEPFAWFEQMYAQQANDVASSRALLDQIVKLPKALAAALAALVKR